CLPLFCWQFDPVAGRPDVADGDAERGDDLAQLGHQHLHDVGGVVGLVHAPQVGDEPPVADRAGESLGQCVSDFHALGRRLHTLAVPGDCIGVEVDERLVAFERLFAAGTDVHGAIASSMLSSTSAAVYPARSSSSTACGLSGFSSVSSVTSASTLFMPAIIWRCSKLASSILSDAVPTNVASVGMPASSVIACVSCMCAPSPLRFVGFE